ncbi:discoidin domain-containing protein [Paenibacillus planticolens]|nr:discoidin domain-containing protein [Paenibacillus planticolens]
MNTNKVEAAQTNGTAPYMNQWAVSGPFTNEQSLGNIVPVIGNSFTDPNSTETSTWQYFDDRIFNRNYDDYNDLMGYFDVKQGQNTLNKWVVAGTYVYSPTAQTVQWQVGGSGVYKLFANDILSGQQTQIPDRLNKNGTGYTVNLKQGWNKLLIEIQHQNPGANKNFLGFYTRLCDSKGNAIPGLTYSVWGPNVTNNQLNIVTQGLAIDKQAFDARNANVPANDYPSNTLPYAYDENPYVWMVPKIDNQLNTDSSAAQASPFTFQAAGGDPSYIWEIAAGQLPPGLTLASDGHIDGIVADGAQGTSQKDYAFTVKVTDAQGATATHPYTITVKENPVDWFIEGKMSALSHTTGTYPNLYDPNYNYDAWAQAAKELGMTMLSTETLQNTIYYWPSPNANLTPSDSNVQYKYNSLYKSEDGKWHVQDRVMQAKQAVERYGMKFGLYVAGLYEGRYVFDTDIQALVARYNPWYIFVDGNPQNDTNLDVSWSSARNYNDRILFDANPNAQTGDQDITLMERGFWYDEPYNNGWKKNILPQTRKVAHEEWNDPFTTAFDVWAQYAGGNERDNWIQLTKEIIDQYGHGYVMNYDQSIGRTRGMDNLFSNLDNTNIFSMIPIESQNLLGMRSNIAKWMANASGPDLRESMYGTLPYTMDYTIKSGWQTDPQKAIANGQGPDWGYAMSRDQYVYMHMIKNLIPNTSKAGFTGQASMSGIGPFDYPVDKVEWLNKGGSLPFTTQQSNGKTYITIDTSSVVADPIDTIIKITTQNPARKYKMTSVKLFSSQTEPNKLKLRAESYMNNYTNVFAPATLSYISDKTSVATVDSATGLVTAVGNGTATITVTATYDDGVNAPQVKTDTYPVKVSGGAISAALPLVGVNMFTNGALFWGQFSTNKDIAVTFQGFTEKGGTVDILGGTNIKYHYATVDGNRNNPASKIIVTEVPANQVPFVVNGNTMQFTSKVSTPTMYSYWADITVDGKTYTSTRNYITLVPDVNVAVGITPTVTSDSSNAAKLSDGIINDSTGGNLSKWVAPASDANPSITYDLGKLQKLNRVNIFFNHHMPNANNVTYYNVPNKVKIEYSVDGTNWIAGNETNTLSGGGLPTSRNTLAVPKSDTTLYAWEQEGLYYNYPIDPSKPDVQARYVRVSFPGGGQGGSPIDVLDVQVFSSADLTALGSIKLDPKIATDNKTVTVGVKGSSYLGDPIDLTDANITITSDKSSVAAVSADGVITAGAEGKAKINVSVKKGGYIASDYFYVTVDAEGKIVLNPFLKEVKLSLNKTTIQSDKPIIASIDGLLNTGETTDLSRATVKYQFSDARLSVVEGSNTIIVKGDIGSGFNATVVVKVTLDGETVESRPMTIASVRNNIPQSQMTATATSQETAGANNVASMAIDGNSGTFWHTKWTSDVLPQSIKLNLGGTYNIDTIDYLPRQDGGSNGNITSYNVYVSTNGVDFAKVASGTWANDNKEKFATFTPTNASYVKLEATAGTGGFASAAEINIFEVKAVAKTIVDYKSVAMDTGLGKIPSLPAQIEAVYNDGTTGLVDVAWAPITVDMVSHAGVFTVNGTVAGTSVQAKVICRVVPGLKPVLKDVKLSFNNKVIKKNEPIVGTLVGTLNTGEQADLSRAAVHYVFSDSRLEAVPGSNTIVIKGDLNRAFLSTVKANVTLDGVTLETNQETISALVDGNIANIASVSVISVRYDDSRYVGIKAIDGDKDTSWASSPNDNTKAPWIKLDFAAPLTIGKVNLVDRGHKINEIGEGILEWEGGSKKVENIKWEGKPDNFVIFDTPIVTSWIKFTIDPDNKFPNSSPVEQGELGLSEFEVYAANKDFVKTIVDYKSVAMDTNLGEIPSLPAQIEAVYNDGTTGLVDVAWAPITVDMVSHAGVFTVNGTVAGTSVKAKAIYRVVGDEPVASQATLKSAQQVTSGQTFDVTMGLNVTQSVYQQLYAQDFTLKYDPSSVQFDSVTSLKDGFQVIDKKETAPGQLRIVTASVGANVPAQGDLLAIKFTAKSVTQATNTTISVGNVVIANGEGNELKVGGASRDIQITISSIPVDKSLLNMAIANAQAKYDAAVEGNEDGLYAIGSKAQLQSAIDAAKVAVNDSNATQQQVDSAKDALEAAVQVFDSKRISTNINGVGGVTIGDLAIVAAAYGTQQGQAGWNEKADVNHDGKVDVLDLAIVAKAILQ